MNAYWEDVWQDADILEYRGYLDQYAAAQLAFVQLFKAAGVKRVLDAACGFGAYSVLLHANGFTVSGFDIAESAVLLTRRLLKERDIPAQDYLVSSILDTPYADGAFDAVAAHAVLDHLKRADAARAVAELMRVVRRGGLVYLSFDRLSPEDEEFAHTVLPDGSYLYTAPERMGLLFHYYTDEAAEALLAPYPIFWRKTNARGDRQFILRKE